MNHLGQKLLALASLAAWIAAGTGAVGCGDDAAGDNHGDHGHEGGSGGGGGSGGSGGEGGSASGGEGGSSGGGSGGMNGGGSGGTGGGAACDPTADPETVVEEDIDANTTWACGTYILEHKIHVIGNSTLTIDPGVVVMGDALTAGDPPALIITRGSRIVAEGTKTSPIVFTSALSETERAPGDFGGLVMLGKAKINAGSCVDDDDTGTPACDAPGYLQNSVEGIPPDDERGIYGGTDDAWDCGSLKYVRVEFGGFKLGMDNELNGITFGACGSKTKASYIQVHRGSDDGVEFFGGTAGMDHVVLSGNLDDNIDWDLGWRGKAQFVVIHQFEGEGDKGIESDNLGENEIAEPVSDPELWNVTMLGTSTHTAIHSREGTHGKLRNFIISGYALVMNLSEALVVPADIFMEDDGWSLKSSFLFDNAALGPDAAAETGLMDDDQGFDEKQAFADAIADAANGLHDDVDPKIDLGFTVGGSKSPDYVPGADAADLEGEAPSSGFDKAATYAGAIEPGGADWTADWTTFPEGG